MRQALTIGVCDGQEALSGQTLFSPGTCTPPLPALGWCVGTPWPVPSWATPLLWLRALPLSVFGKAEVGGQSPRGSGGVECLRQGYLLTGDEEGVSAVGAGGRSSHALPSAAGSTLLFPIIYYLTTVLACFLPGQEGWHMGHLLLVHCQGRQQCPPTKGGGPRPRARSIHPHCSPDPPLKTYFCWERQGNLATENSWDGSQRRLMASLTSPVYL